MHPVEGRVHVGDQFSAFEKPDRKDTATGHRSERHGQTISYLAVTGASWSDT